MDKIKIRGEIISCKHKSSEYCRACRNCGETATIELTPLELVEQISHKDMNEILKLINIPTIERLCVCEKPEQCELSECKEIPHCKNCGKLIKPQPAKPLCDNCLREYHCAIKGNIEFGRAIQCDSYSPNPNIHSGFFQTGRDDGTFWFFPPAVRCRWQ